MIRQQAQDRELLRTLRHRALIIQDQIRRSGGNIALFQQLERTNLAIHAINTGS